MKPKPLRIDWDTLEEAFSSQNADLVYYLDLINGKVFLEGEGSEDEEEDDDDYTRAAIPEPSLDDDETRLEIRPPSTERKIGWLEAFLPTVEPEHGEMVEQLRVAIPSDDPESEISAVLRAHPEGREAWFLYRADKVQEMIEGWIEKNAIPFIDPPPWRDS